MQFLSVPRRLATRMLLVHSLILRSNIGSHLSFISTRRCVLSYISVSISLWKIIVRGLDGLKRVLLFVSPDCLDATREGGLWR